MNTSHDHNESKFRTIHKIELASRISSNEEEFYRYLDGLEVKHIEEFFNKCHGKGGKFCKGKSIVPKMKPSTKEKLKKAIVKILIDAIDSAADTA